MSVLGEALGRPTKNLNDEIIADESRDAVSDFPWGEGKALKNFSYPPSPNIFSTNLGHYFF